MYPRISCRRIAEINKRLPRVRQIFADCGLAGDKLRSALGRISKRTVQIEKRSDTTKGFVVLPCRRVVRRTLEWLNRSCRLTVGFEQTIASATA